MMSHYLLAAFFHSILNSLSLLFFILFLVTVKKASQLKKAPSNLCESIISYHRKTSGKIFRIINKWRENVLAIYVLSVWIGEFKFVNKLRELFAINFIFAIFFQFSRILLCFYLHFLALFLLF